jgi:hypothetical protein
MSWFSLGAGARAHIVGEEDRNKALAGVFLCPIRGAGVDSSHKKGSRGNDLRGRGDRHAADGSRRSDDVNLSQLGTFEPPPKP